MKIYTISLKYIYKYNSNAQHDSIRYLHIYNNYTNYTELYEEELVEVLKETSPSYTCRRLCCSTK